MDPVAGGGAPGGLNAPGMPLALRREQANAALAAAAAAAAVLAPRRLEPLKMSAKDRLAAFQLRVHGGGPASAGGGLGPRGDDESPPGSPASGGSHRQAQGAPAYSRGRNGVKYYRSKHDPDYLGGGLHRPHPEVVATYEAVRADIAAHAVGLVHARVPEGTVVIQRGAGAGSGAAGAHFHGGAGGHRGGQQGAHHGGHHGGGGEEVPGPVRAFRGGVMDKTLQARKYKVERRFGMPPPPSELAQQQHHQGAKRGLQVGVPAHVSCVRVCGCVGVEQQAHGCAVSHTTHCPCPFTHLHAPRNQRSLSPVTAHTTPAPHPALLQARRANVLAAAMLEELNARLTGAEVEREAPVTDRLADVLTGTTATAGAAGLPMRGGKAGGGWEDEDESDAASLRSLRM